MLKVKKSDVFEVKTLDEQMLEYSKRKEKNEQLKKELSLNSEWDIIEDDILEEVEKPNTHQVQVGRTYMYSSSSKSNRL